MRRTFIVSRDEVALGPDEQRRRLLRDLHDTVGPTLAAAALGVRAVRNLVNKDSAAAEQILVRLEEELHSAIAEIRRIANDLHPIMLDRLGFVAAVRQHAETLTSRMAAAGGALQIDVDVCGELPVLPAAVEVAAYRIVSEALTNVSRHSNARRCVVRIWFDNELRLEIVDDGTGAMVDGPSTHTGVGLGSMRERACSLGGSLVIERVPPSGTRVAATLPFRVG